MRIESALVGLGLVCALAVGWPSIIRAAEAASNPPPDPLPVAVVESLHEGIIKAWRSYAGFEDRYRSLEPVVGSVFDLQAMSSLVLGPAGTKLDQAQRRRFTDTFRRLTVSTYASRFSGYKGERFETREQRDLPGGQQFVRTDLVKQNGEQVRLDYLLHWRNERWQIVNVIAKGVSDLAIKRSEYGRVMRGDGFEALIERLERQIRDMADGKEASRRPALDGYARL